MAIQFVGGFGAGTNTTAATYNVSLTSLTGGLASSPAAGDLVLVFTGYKDTSNTSPGLTSPLSAIQLADLFANSINDANLSVNYFWYSGETTITCRTQSGTGGKATAIAVFRGVDRTNPFDATFTTATTTGNSNGSINPPAITPVTAGAWVLCGGLSAAGSGGTVPASFTAPAGYIRSANGSSASSGSDVAYTAICYNSAPFIGSVNDPANMVGNNGGSGSSGIAVTMALRPMNGQIKAWNGAAWAIEPVKCWNGSSWVTKPVKRWNGSAWAATTY